VTPLKAMSCSHSYGGGREVTTGIPTSQVLSESRPTTTTNNNKHNNNNDKWFNYIQESILLLGLIPPPVAAAVIVVVVINAVFFVSREYCFGSEAGGSLGKETGIPCNNHWLHMDPKESVGK